MNNIVVYIDENIPLLSRTLSPYANVKEYSGRNLTNEELRSSKCKILLTRSQTKINKELLEGTDIKLTGTATSGIDHVDLQYLKSNGIEFISAPGSNANSVAEYVVYSVLKWLKMRNYSGTGINAGVIGFGYIGKIVSKYFEYMGFDVYVNDPPLLEIGEDFPDHYYYSELNSIMKHCDIITNHVPLNYEGDHSTFNLINEQSINLIKKRSLLIHASRGKVVDETALKQRVIDAEIDTAVDVWKNEPEFDCELANACILATPHIAGYSYEGKLRGSLILARKFADFTKLDVDLSHIENELSEYKPAKPKEFKRFDILYKQLREARQFDTDKLQLLASCTNKESIKERFDYLRKNYPRRHESL